jgi:hypothetical protein
MHVMDTQDHGTRLYVLIILTQKRHTHNWIIFNRIHKPERHALNTELVNIHTTITT